VTVARTQASLDRHLRSLRERKEALVAHREEHAVAIAARLKVCYSCMPR
jgi:hypothetical protein